MNEPQYDHGLKYGAMTLHVLVITPALAKRFLMNNSGNRRLRAETVKQYSRDMQNDAWEDKPVPICFDEEGRLGNGQHTLSAIVDSGIPQTLLVATGVPRKAIAMMDRGIQRTVSDVAKFLESSMESRRASIARVIEWGPDDTLRRSFQELFDAYQRHEEVIEFVCRTAPAKVAGLGANVLAVCAKAAYSRDRADISRFLVVMQTGVPAGEHEAAAIRLRDFVRSLRGGSSSKTRVETYRRAMASLSHFLAGTSVSRIYGTEADLFPVPGAVLPTAKKAQA